MIDDKRNLKTYESVPSSKVQSLKIWLANLGSERIDEAKQIANKEGETDE